MKSLYQIGLGGGCHWCTEAVFQQLDGVLQVHQGYICSASPYEDWSEAILLTYDSQRVSLEEIVEVHLATHASTVAHSRRTTYRSAVYFMTIEQQSLLEVIMSSLKRKHHKNYITQVIPFVDFKASREQIQNYYKTRPDAPFCKRYIEPKLRIVDQFKSKYLKTN